MGSSVLLAVLQVAAGGSLVQIFIRLAALVYKRFSNPEQRKATVAADHTSVETAADVLIMVRGELKEVRAQHALDRQAWDTERVANTRALEDAGRELQRAISEVARLKSELAVATARLPEPPQPPAAGRHSNPGAYDDWRRSI